MHTLSIFPQFLTFWLVGPLILRLAVGMIRLYADADRFKTNTNYKWLAIPGALSSICLIIGLYTQVAVLVSIFMVLVDHISKKKKAPVSREQTIITVLFVAILISLIFTGPGFFAFDYPL